MRVMLGMLGAAAVALLVGCERQPEVVTYKLVYPSKGAAAPAVAPPLPMPANGELPPMPADHPPIAGVTKPAEAKPATGTPAMPGADMAAMPLPAGTAPAGPSPFAVDAPAGWVAKPPSSMRLVSFTVPGAEAGKDGDFSVIMMGGEAGGVVNNVNRWRGQVNLEQASEADIKAALKEVPTKLGEPAQVVQLDGAEASILAAMINHDGNMVFVKLAGPKATVTAARPAFEQVVASLRTEGGQ